MAKHRNEAEKLSLLKEYLISGKSSGSFVKGRNISEYILRCWLKDYRLPTTTLQTLEDTASRAVANEDKLRLEIAEMRKELAELEKRVRRAELQALA